LINAMLQTWSSLTIKKTANCVDAQFAVRNGLMEWSGAFQSQRPFDAAKQMRLICFADFN